MKKFWKKWNKNKSESLEQLSKSDKKSINTRNAKSLEELSNLNNSPRSSNMSRNEAKYKTKTELLMEHLKELDEKNDKIFQENGEIFKEISKKEDEATKLNFEISDKKFQLRDNDRNYDVWKERYNAETFKRDEQNAISSNARLLELQQKLKSENEILTATINTLEMQNKEMKEKLKGFRNEKQQEQRDLEAR